VEGTAFKGFFTVSSIYLTTSLQKKIEKIDHEKVPNFRSATSNNRGAKFPIISWPGTRDIRAKPVSVEAQSRRVGSSPSNKELKC
jgi:hypothetical protein